MILFAASGKNQIQTRAFQITGWKNRTSGKAGFEALACKNEKEGRGEREREVEGVCGCVCVGVGWGWGGVDSSTESIGIVEMQRRR